MSNRRGNFEDRGAFRNKGKYQRSRYNKWRGGYNENRQRIDEATTSGNYQQKITEFTDSLPNPYKAWNLYLPNESYNEHSVTVKNIQTFEKYFLTWDLTSNTTEILMQGSITVDYKELIEHEKVKSNWPTFTAELTDSPEKVLNCIGLAMHQVLSVNLENSNQENLDGETEKLETTPYISVRITNYGPFTPLKNLKTNYHGKLIAVKGTVVRVGNCKPLCLRMAFSCNTCGNVQGFPQSDGKYSTPTACTDRECKGRIFKPELSSDIVLMVDWQTIRVQETTSDSVFEIGRIPRTVECELTNDLVDTCIPGDIVTITGIVKAMSSDDGNPRGQKESCMNLLFIHAVSVSNVNRQAKHAAEPFHVSPMDFSVKELYGIKAIHSEDNLFRLLVHSLCPDICGHEMVKAGLLLGLFGGNTKHTDDLNSVPVRGNPHVLVVGDPGLGKSQMLRSCAGVAPRGVYVCGNTTTEAGLTVTVVKDNSQAETALEAGALALADQGCCCIDEFDKMGNQHQALLEAMEQQCISIAKAGMVCNLPTRTSVLAAANPVGGHYNRAKTVSENLRLGSALLSRFDLIFILVDRPDEEMDSLLSEHVLSLHSQAAAGSSGLKTRGGKLSVGEASILQMEEEIALAQRLKCQPGESIDAIPHQLLRKYLSYARQYVKPVLSPDARAVIQKFYKELRKKHHTSDSTPITTRQLESLIRLTEARARMELREEATAEDASDIVDIMKHSMIDTCSDSFGELDFQRSQLGVGSSFRGMCKKFIAELTKVSERTNSALFTVNQMKEIAKGAKMKIDDFGDFICSLNNQNYLLKKGPSVYKLSTVSI